MIYIKKIKKMSDKIIFWDMDYTLGSFGQISYEMEKKKIPDYLPEFGLRQGIEKLLKELSDKGYTHYVTSSASGDYANEALKRTDIIGYFNKVYAREDIDGYDTPKKYRWLIKQMNIPAEEAGKHILIIGDKKNDVPHNMDNIVTILDNQHFMRDASLTKIMIGMLENAGQGDFHKGFMKLYSHSEKMPRAYNFIQPIGRILVEKNAELHLMFMESRENCSRAPVFEVYRAIAYIK